MLTQGVAGLLMGFGQILDLSLVDGCLLLETSNDGLAFADPPLDPGQLSLQGPQFASPGYQTGRSMSRSDYKLPVDVKQLSGQGDETHSRRRTRAESHGMTYETVLALSDEADGTRLSMEFGGEPQTLAARALALTMGWMFKGATAKALRQDLADIKVLAERTPTP